MFDSKLIPPVHIRFEDAELCYQSTKKIIKPLNTDQLRLIRAALADLYEQLPHDSAEFEIICIRGTVVHQRIEDLNQTRRRPAWLSQLWQDNSFAYKVAKKSLTTIPKRVTR